MLARIIGITLFLAAGALLGGKHQARPVLTALAWLGAFAAQYIVWIFALPRSLFQWVADASWSGPIALLGIYLFSAAAVVLAVVPWTSTRVRLASILLLFGIGVTGAATEYQRFDVVILTMDGVTYAPQPWTPYVSAAVISVPFLFLGLALEAAVKLLRARHRTNAAA